MVAAKPQRKPAPDSYQIRNVWSQVHTWTLLYSGGTKHCSLLDVVGNTIMHSSWRLLLEWDLINKLLWQSGALNPNHWYCSTPTTTIKSTVLGRVVLSANPWPDPTQLYSTLWYLSQQFTLQVSRFPSWSRHINKWNLTGGPTFFVSMLSRMYHDLAIDTVWN